MALTADAIPLNNSGTTGLTSEQVLLARELHGSNKLVYQKESRWQAIIKGLAGEPMVILLLIAAVIYFINGETADAIFMAASIILVSTISLYQDKKSRKALKKLEEFNQPLCTVIRNGAKEQIKIEDIVTGDFLIVEEGTMIAADGEIVRSNDFSVNESALTGESLPVYKDCDSADNLIYRGTTVASGLAIAKITAIGNNTRWGSIGKSLESVKEEKTPLEIQIGNFVRKMVIAGAVVFIIVWIINYLHSRHIADSLLKALTLAMSILPEEIPVAFTTFMALGAWRLMKMGIIVKQMKTVETLGSATVICVDKTGTITENSMRLSKLYVWPSASIIDIDDELTAEDKGLIRIAMWASEPIPFDPMETALHQAYKSTTLSDERPEYKMIHEYPLGGIPPMMTHVFEDRDLRRIIAAKGAPEALMGLCDLSRSERNEINSTIKTLTAEGYRVLGVAQSEFEGYDFPGEQQELPFLFKGLVAFYDPPKKNIKSVLKAFYDSGIGVRIITGDNPLTAMSIAREIAFKGYEQHITGNELMKLSDNEREKEVQNNYLFARMFPEAKLAVVNILKGNNEVVAMTGDGINDGPALKAAHIGIAMGKKGTEIAKAAASLILVEDDLSKMVEAVAMGRKIYANLKKAIQYIISIHIPIILTVFVPLALSWIYPNIFTPIHVIFLELVMGPTCSIVYENEPMEKNAMKQKPRALTTTFFNWRELATSVIQGLVITAGTLFVYQWAANNNFSESITRSMVFITLITANIFLTLVNRSFYYSIITTLKSRNYMIPVVILITTGITVAIFFIGKLTEFFAFGKPNLFQLSVSFTVGFISVIWYELVKWQKRYRTAKI
ncbi:cation-translocating P-type ATPase [Mucilaginibacter sp. BT774]|uniref:cation-translocating P-type ATPase n=1 Tax=Mucilaginibacter sp. BT774 TaxID=3062276 RepID=UPI002676BA82|nr:cation-translocating P-type ATPase [Mucilaginibacter sp. BT774]MDO3628061.1 cation-translocating P-type ATPase [Mucilaginibacter sp. BT774]